MASFIGNFFVLGMLPEDGATIFVEPCDPDEIPGDALSVVGHEGTAAVYSALLNRAVGLNRTTVALTPGDRLFVGAIKDADGKPFRLPEGKMFTASELLALTIHWTMITVDFL